jgi:hypothetical protein
MDFSVERLYYNDRFQSFLDKLTYKSRIRDREDFKHDVFAEMIGVDVESVEGAKRAARRIAYQYIRDAEQEGAIVDQGAII